MLLSLSLPPSFSTVRSPVSQEDKIRKATTLPPPIRPCCKCNVTSTGLLETRELEHSTSKQSAVKKHDNRVWSIALQEGGDLQRCLGGRNGAGFSQPSSAFDGLERASNEDVLLGSLFYRLRARS